MDYGLIHPVLKAFMGTHTVNAAADDSYTMVDANDGVGLTVAWIGNTKPLCADGPRRCPPLPMALHAPPSALRQPPERPAARHSAA